MIHYSSEVTIARPPHEVCEALLDPERYPQWTDMVEVSFDANPPRVGTRGRFRLAKGPIKDMLDMEIRELEPDRRVVFQVTHPTLDWRAVSTLEATGTGTRLTYAGETSSSVAGDGCWSRWSPARCGVARRARRCDSRSSSNRVLMLEGPGLERCAG